MCLSFCVIDLFFAHDLHPSLNDRGGLRQGTANKNNKLFLSGRHRSMGELNLTQLPSRSKRNRPVPYVVFFFVIRGWFVSLMVSVNPTYEGPQLAISRPNRNGRKVRKWSVYSSFFYSLCMIIFRLRHTIPPPGILIYSPHSE